jgi:hypothetical protein
MQIPRAQELEFDIRRDGKFVAPSSGPLALSQIMNSTYLPFQHFPFF